MSGELPVVDLRYYFLYIAVDLLNAEIGLFLDLFQQMGLQELDMLIYREFPLL